MVELETVGDVCFAVKRRRVVVIFMLCVAALVVILINVMLLRYDVETVRIAAPVRVVQDDKELSPEPEKQAPIDPLA